MPPPPAIAGRKAPRSSHLQLNGQSCERDLLLDFGQTETAAGQAGIVEPPAASWIGKPTQHTTSDLVHPSTIAIRRLAWQAACSSCISSDNLSGCWPYCLSGLFLFRRRGQSWVSYKISNGALQPPTAWSGELAQRTLGISKNRHPPKKAEVLYCIVLYTHVVYLLYI